MVMKEDMSILGIWGIWGISTYVLKHYIINDTK